MRVRPRFPRPARSAIVGLVAAVVALSCAVAPVGAAAKKPTSVTKKNGAVTAKVTYTPADRKHYKDYKKIRLTITGHGHAVRNVSLAPNSTSYTRPIVTLTDLNGDGVPDPIVDTYSGGAHCCSTSSISLSTTTGYGAPIVQAWGDYGYQLKDLGGTSTPEFVSADDRFAYAFTAYAGSIPAIKILAADGPIFHDVTTNFPDAIRADIAKITPYWDDAAKNANGDPEGVQAVTAAWVADLTLVNDLAGAKAVIDKTTAAGFMTGGPSENWENAKTYAGQLAYDLKHWGYLDDPTTIGLPATS
ncbi:MAG: hypothetical protein AAGC46_16465 [Solirubrobacteraceae bacterium]|nr:hypothetical protein [Patulibacter sp.]